MNKTVTVFGLGYVGCVSAACLAKAGNRVIGVELNASKAEAVREGRATIYEAGVAELVAEMVAAGRLTATTDAESAVRQSDVSLICVGTPSRPNGSIDLSALKRACTQVGWALQNERRRHVVVLRSTVLPGTSETEAIPALETAAGRKLGGDLGYCVNPEFLREGSSIEDFYEPPFSVIGASEAGVAEEVAPLYGEVAAPLHVVPIRVAEMLKYACNGFHALKVGFANEIGSLCKALGVDSHEVMRLFCEDRRLNISPAYLQPGFAFGGSCLPKDLRALIYEAKGVDVELPMLGTLLESNRKHMAKAADMVLATRARRVGILGMSFKAGTDDLRESPMVALIELLIGKGLELAIYDKEVSRANLVGANREYIEREVPHIWSLVRSSVSDVLAMAEVVVVGKSNAEFAGIESRLRSGQRVIDLVRAFPGRRSDGRTYEGICW